MLPAQSVAVMVIVLEPEERLTVVDQLDAPDTEEPVEEETEERPEPPELSEAEPEMVAVEDEVTVPSDGELMVTVGAVVSRLTVILAGLEDWEALSMAIAVMVLLPSEPRETPVFDQLVVPEAAEPLTVTDETVPGEVSEAEPDTVTELSLVKCLLSEQLLEGEEMETVGGGSEAGSNAENSTM